MCACVRVCVCVCVQRDREKGQTEVGEMRRGRKEMEQTQGKGQRKMERDGKMQIEIKRETDRQTRRKRSRGREAGEHVAPMGTARPLIDGFERGPPPGSSSNLPDAPRASTPHIPRAPAWRGLGRLELMQRQRAPAWALRPVRSRTTQAPSSPLPQLLQSHMSKYPSIHSRLRLRQKQQPLWDPGRRDPTPTAPH